MIQVNRGRTPAAGGGGGGIGWPFTTRPTIHVVGATVLSAGLPDYLDWQFDQYISTYHGITTPSGVPLEVLSFTTGLWTLPVEVGDYVNQYHVYARYPDGTMQRGYANPWRILTEPSQADILRGSYAIWTLYPYPPAAGGQVITPLPLARLLSVTLDGGGSGGPSNDVVFTFDSPVTYNGGGMDSAITCNAFGPGSCTQVSANVIKLHFISAVASGDPYVISAQPSYINEVVDAPRSGTVA